MSCCVDEHARTNARINLEDVTRDLGRSSTFKATLSAGFVQQVAQSAGVKAVAGDLGKLGVPEKLTYNLINATGRALTNTAINGGSLEDALKSSLVGALVDTAHGQAASAIKSLESDYLAHKLAHALAGCVAGAAAGAEVRHFRAVFTPPADPGSNQIKDLEVAGAIFV